MKHEIADKEYYILADLCSFLFQKTYLALEVNKKTDEVYWFSIKKKKIEKINLNLYCFLLFFTKYIFFIEEYTTAKFKSPLDISEAFISLKKELRSIDDLGYCSFFWKDKVSQLESEIGDHLPTSIYYKNGKEEALDHTDSDEPF